jgi:RNA polymerase sigma factor (sigma-70 family)
LLENYLTRQDEASFEVLVWRHGSMVMNLCRRVLRDSHAAEDVFQSTFLIFARKARSIGNRESVGSWLYKVAYRLSLRARTRSAKLSDHEEPARDLAAPERPDEVMWRDLRPVLDEEIDRLPEKYRAPFVLCYLEGQTNEEAAEELGCPKGTILSRLARGRQRLQSRLLRRGIALGAAGFALILPEKASSAAASAALVSRTIEASLLFSTGKAAAELVSASVAVLTEGALRSMYIAQLKMTLAAMAAMLLLGGGVSWLARQAFADNTRSADRNSSSSRDTESSSERTANKGSGSGGRSPEPSETIHGKVTDVAKDGKSFNLEVPTYGRGEEPKKLQVTLDDKSTVTYFNVGSNGASPTVGYSAEVKLAQKGKDLASNVRFRKDTEGRTRGGRGDVAGKVVAVARDGKAITIELPRDPSQPRDADAPRAEYKFTDKTQLIFSNVPRGGAALAEGLEAHILLDDPKGSTPLIVYLKGSVPGTERGRSEADVVGKIIAIGKDKEAITVEVVPKRSRERTEEAKEPQKLEIMLTDKTTSTYFNVGVDGTKIAEGFGIHVWFASGSKNTAESAWFTGPTVERGTVVSGKVTQVSQDGKSFTIEEPAQRPRDRNEEPKPGKKVEILITSKTRVFYNGVGTGEAKPSEGYVVQARLDETGRDTWEVTFSKPGEERGGR